MYGLCEREVKLRQKIKHYTFIVLINYPFIQME